MDDILSGLAIGLIMDGETNSIKGPAKSEYRRCELAMFVVVIGDGVRCDGGLPTRIYFNFMIFFSFFLELPPAFPKTCRSWVVILLRITKERVVSIVITGFFLDSFTTIVQFLARFTQCF